ncbi:hypothetical protein HFP69_03165 [Streptomyces sp. ARC12]|uniref:hypothetical protein n=1 Tax=Streptomyces sp. ARC12 TaxID=2724151 RepID=UPI003857B143
MGCVAPGEVKVPPADGRLAPAGASVERTENGPGELPGSPLDPGPCSMRKTISYFDGSAMASA